MTIQVTITKTTHTEIDLEFERNPDLEGKAINLVDAARKYDLAHQTLARWANKGLLRIIDHQPKRLKLDEADVQLAARIYKAALRHTDNTRKAGWVLKRALSA